MIGAIIEFSARHRGVVLILVAVAAVFGYHAMRNTKLDAIPDLCDTQVIVYAKWDRSPDIMEDQVTYPITSALLGMPNVKDIRGFSDFGYSYIYIIFDEGTDLYWARSRTLEYLNPSPRACPRSASVELAKDATSVGWVYQYALVDTTRAVQPRPVALAIRTGICAMPCSRSRRGRGRPHWRLRARSTRCKSIPIKLQAYKIPINAVGRRGAASPTTTSADDWWNSAGREYMVRGRGYMRSLDDIGNIVLVNNARQWHAGSRQRRGDRHARPGHAARRCRSGRQGRGRRRRGHHALRRERRRR